MGSYTTGLFLPTQKAQRLTEIVLAAGAGLYLLYDVFAYKNAKNDSISAVGMAEMYGHPAYTLMLGALMGHLTWPTANARAPSESLKRVVPAIIALALWDRLSPANHPMPPLVPFVLGMPLGHWLFPQDIATEHALIVPVDLRA